MEAEDEQIISQHCLAPLLMEFFLSTYHGADFYTLASILLILANLRCDHIQCDVSVKIAASI